MKWLPKCESNDRRYSWRSPVEICTLSYAEIENTFGVSGNEIIVNGPRFT